MVRPTASNWAATRPRRPCRRASTSKAVSAAPRSSVWQMASKEPTPPTRPSSAPRRNSGIPATPPSSPRRSSPRCMATAALMDDIQTLGAGRSTIAVRKDLRVPMRDGITLVADAYCGIEHRPRPALVALSPYGKELQALALTMPPQRRPSPMWDGCIEAGDIGRVVANDYVHVIGDVRGSGG